MARVLWRDAQGKEGSLELSGGEILIGRGMECAIRTEDGMVSRRHARLYWAAGQYVVEDLGSANGVFYQEQQVAQHTLKHGDAVRCGSLWLRFVDPASAQQAMGQQHGHQAAAQVMTPPPMAQPMGQPMGQGMGQPVPPQPMGQPIPRAISQPASQPVQQLLNQPVQQGMHVPTGPQQAIPAEPQFGADPAKVAADAQEIARLQRKIEQLETELRLYRKGKAAEIAQRIEQLTEKNDALQTERDQLLSKVRELEATLSAESSEAKSRKADFMFTKTAEAVQQINDILSNLRINVMAAEGEFEQFAHTVPRASFELIREALRSSSKDVETARELLRELRNIAG